MGFRRYGAVQLDKQILLDKNCGINVTYLKIEVSIVLWFQFGLQYRKASSSDGKSTNYDVNISWQTSRQPS